MRPAARLQSAIELVDQIILAARDGGASADQIAKRFFAERRYAGSKDRRAVRDLAWGAIRRFGKRPATARSAFVAMADADPALAELFDGTDYGPAVIEAGEARSTGGGLPKWIKPLFSAHVDEAEQASLLDRAPMDLRVNALKASRAEVSEMFPEAEIIAGLDLALRLPGGTAIDSHPAVENGQLEIQDLGSQLIVEACQAKGAATVLDLCAGAGGKTLALAAAMRNTGRLIATDTNRNRLDQLKPRAARAGATNVETRLLNPNKEKEMLAEFTAKCDLVLIDAPCSGSGTWRRNPETRWRLDASRLKRVIDDQARLLDIGADMVARGGHLVYAVCSLIESEGKGQVAAFLKSHKGWKTVDTGVSMGRPDGDGVLLTPLHDGSDGFFFARLQKL
nr:RsmB/NOP family class I SAM-dependent RNA methyltransferase [uncultured Sphingorhabdus sp.]